MSGPASLMVGWSRTLLRDGGVSALPVHRRRMIHEIPAAPEHRLGGAVVGLLGDRRLEPPDRRRETSLAIGAEPLGEDAMRFGTLVGGLVDHQLEHRHRLGALADLH